MLNILNLKPVGQEILSVYSFGMKKAVEKVYPVVEVEVKSLDQSFKTKIRALVIPQISGALMYEPSGQVREFMSKHKLEMADAWLGKDSMNVEILIGSDLFWEFILNERISINHNLGAVKTVFGWVITGQEMKKENSCSQNIAVMKNAVELNDLRIFWEIDSIGISDQDEELSQRDRFLIDDFERKLQLKNNRYITGLVWNSNPDEIDNNFCIAKKRFDNLKEKLNKNKVICEEYKKVIDEQFREGIIEETHNNLLLSGYYMPHKAVLRPDKETTRVRIVFDASSKANYSKSLNDFLISGPNLNPNLLDMIIKFRTFEVAFSSDIEKAYLMIGITEEDRKYLKFLWFDSNNSDAFKVMNMARLPFGIRCSAFILAATIKKHIKNYKESYSDVFDMLNSSLYVDDLYFGTNTVENAYRLTCDASTVLKDASMNLRKFNSNSKELKELWRQNGMSNNPSERAMLLGLEWDTDKDILKIDTSELQNISKCPELSTKRIVLRAAAKVYDPVGYITPFLIRIKLLMQKIWLKGLEWDEQLPEGLNVEFKNWLSEIQKLENISINRRYFLNDGHPGEITVHIFCDVSDKAYGAVAYFRCINKSGKIHTSLVMSKSRVAPLKSLTLPRLELMGAIIAVRIYKYLNKLFNDYCTNTTFWSDSCIVLSWIKSAAKEWKPFICNRIEEIQNISEPKNWNYCPGKENPADLITRGLSVKSLKENSLWWLGPRWLTGMTDWPMQPKEFSITNNIIERRKNIIVKECVIEENEIIKKMQNFSSLLKLLRTIAWMRRFIRKTRKLSVQDGPLSADEIQEAEIDCIKVIQKQNFNSEIFSLKSSKIISKDSSLQSLSPFIDENDLLRIKGRLNESKYTYGERQPILLPKGSQFTELLILSTHNEIFHGGVAATLSKLRESYWIPKGRQAVKKVINQCIICRRYAVKPAKQMTAQLPKDRITETPPFTVCGVDYTGPVYIKDGENTNKSYIALFTCAVTRAVHLELVSDLSTKNFMLALRRFLSRRGNCRVFYSDNAKTFKCANKEIQYFLGIHKDESFQNFISSKGITWKFIVELAPWWGGFYERLMKSIKDPLRKILGRALLNFEELMTVLVEVENILNHRPLTYIYDDASEPEALTPAHFLLAGHKVEYPFNFNEVLNTSINKASLIKRKMYQTKLISQIWQKWKTDYLMGLKSLHSFGTPNAQNNLKTNDIVLIEGSSKSKLLWNLGRILEINKGRDGLVRSCVVKTNKGNLRRPIQLLYPFEISD